MVGVLHIHPKEINKYAELTNNLFVFLFNHNPNIKDPLQYMVCIMFSPKGEGIYLQFWSGDLDPCSNAVLKVPPLIQLRYELSPEKGCGVDFLCSGGEKWQ